MCNFEKIQKSLKEYGLDAIMATSEENRRYASGFPASDGLALITADKVWFFTDSRYIEAAENAITGAKVMQVGSDYPYSKAVEDIVISEKIEKLGYEEKTMNVADYVMWSEKLSVTLVGAQDLFTTLRMVKTEEEIKWMLEAQRIAEKSFLEVIPMITTDITEKELTAELMYRFLKNGADDKSFDPIIVSGPRSSLPHGVPTDEKISKGFITLDFGVKYNGYCSDTTRTLCIGKPTEEMQKVYDIVLRAQLAGIEAAHGGMKGCEIDKAARDVIHEAGYGGRFGHGFGHGVGLEIHEAPNLSPSYDKIVPAGALVSAEPGIYIPGEFGVRIEDVMIITENGSEDITKLDKELIIL